jgi:catechol 2,3-dioxygenase-like lactoylglutathione lyase family enzyme
MDLLTKYQLQYNSRIDFLVNQVLMALPAVFIWAGGLFYLLFNKEGKKYIAIAIIYVGIIAILLYFNGKPYYAAAIYPSLMAFGGIWFSKLVTKRGWGWLRWAMPVFMLLLTSRILALLVPYESAETLVKKFEEKKWVKASGALNWEDHKAHPLPQDYADMLGWKEMAEKTAKVYHALPDSIKAQTMVYGDNYGEAGALAFYRKKLGLPEIFSDNASFLFWLPEHFTTKYFLFVTEEMPEADDAFFNHWGKVEIKDSVTQRYAREFNAKIILYSQPDDSVRIIAEQHINADRKRFGIRK